MIRISYCSLMNVLGEIKEEVFMGLLLALSGLDGSGKTTQVIRLVEQCEKMGISVSSIQLKTVDSGKYIYIAKKKMQEYILCSKLENSRELYNIGSAYAYTEKVNDVVLTSMQTYDLTILDRYRESAMCFHYLRDTLYTSVLNIYDNLTVPDLNVYLDLPPIDCYYRVLQRGPQAPHETLEYLEKAYGFYSMMKERFTYIDASLKPEDITGIIWSKIESLI